MISKKNSILISLSLGVVVSVLIFLLLGLPTDVIENQRYVRMIPSTGLDMFFLVTTSILFGVYVGLITYIWIFLKWNMFSTKPSVGVLGGYFAVSCPVCISFFVSIFGVVFLMKYYDPLRPFVGVLSIGLIIFGIYKGIQVIRNKSKTCRI